MQRRPFSSQEVTLGASAVKKSECCDLTLQSGPPLVKWHLKFKVQMHLLADFKPLQGIFVFGAAQHTALQNSTPGHRVHTR